MGSINLVIIFLKPVAKNDTPLVISLHQNIKHRITLNERKTRAGRNVCPSFFVGFCFYCCVGQL